MKTSDDEAHVCLGKGGGGRAGSGGYGSCEMKELGMGTVKEIINEHYSVVKFDSGVPFEEGTVVERR